MIFINKFTVPALLFMPHTVPDTNQATCITHPFTALHSPSQSPPSFLQHPIITNSTRFNTNTEMNPSFRHVANFVKHKEVLNHQQQVTRLYRHSLKLMASWVIDRRIILDYTTKIRSRFDQYKDDAKESPRVQYALQDGLKELEKYVHVDPYVLPWMPGGSKFMRNPPLPPDAAYGGHAPHEAFEGTNTPVYPDMVPLTFRKEHKAVLVDFSKKSYE